MSSIIMLMQLGILGQCSIRLIPERFHMIHFACILQEKISKVIQRKGLAPTDTENENFTLDEHEVGGLIYCVVEKFTELCEVASKRGFLQYFPFELDENSDWKQNCACPVLSWGEMSWIDKDSLSRANRSTKILTATD